MDHIEKPDDLLENIWFFGNSLDKKTKTKPKTMLRSYSDPSPVENEKVAKTKEHHHLKRAPSLPPSIGREKVKDEKEIEPRSKGKSSLRKPNTSLHRAPSLPPCVGRDEDAESEFSLSRLIRQASLTSSDDSLPPKHNSKPQVIKQVSSAPRYRPQTKPLPKNTETETFQETKTQSMKVETRLRRSVSDARLHEFVGKEQDTNYKFDRRYKNPLEFPSFQEKQRIGYGESSSADDMKAQIKYWARAVAANVR